MSFNHQDLTPQILRKNPHPKETIQVVKQHPNKTQSAIKTEKIYDPKDPDAEPDIRPVMIDKAFGQKIIKARSLKGLTQQQFANILSIPVKVINEYERGEGVRNGNYINKINNWIYKNTEQVE